MTARDLITSALYDAGIIALGRQPKAAELDECIRRANMMFGTWSTRDLPWREDTISLSGTADVAQVTMPANVIAVSAVRYVDSAVNERDMGRFERDDYRILPNKAAKGIATIYQFDRKLPAPVLNVWPVPPVAFALNADVTLSIPQIVEASDDIEFPPEWREAVMKNIGARCARIFLGETPQSLAMEAAALERELFDYARPASYFMGAC